VVSRHLETVGRCIAIYPNDEDVTFSGFCIRYRVENHIVEPLYLVHLFRNESFKKKMLQGGRGANIQNINQKILSEIGVPLPPPESQNQFADIVRQINDLDLSALETQATTLKQALTQGLLS